MATPADVAAQIVALASPRVSGHVSGQVVMVDGGFEGRRLNTAEEIDERMGGDAGEGYGPGVLR